MPMRSPTLKTNTVKLRKIVGWVKQSATQQSPGNVGFRSSTQPTQLHNLRFLALTQAYCIQNATIYAKLHLEHRSGT